MIHLQLFYLLFCFSMSLFLSYPVLTDRKITTQYKIVFIYLLLISLTYLIHSYVYNYVYTYEINLWGFLQLLLFLSYFIFPWFAHSLVELSYKKLWNFLFIITGVFLFTLRLLTDYTWISYLLVIPIIYFTITGFIYFRKEYEILPKFFSITIPFIIIDFFKVGYLKSIDNPLVIEPIEFFPILSVLFGLLILLKLKHNQKRNLNGRNIMDNIKTWDLSDREVDVLKLLVQSKQNREIAEELFVSESTVKKHISSILKKSCCSNRVQIINKCY